MKEDSEWETRRWTLWLSAWVIAIAVMAYRTYPVCLNAPFIISFFPLGFTQLAGLRYSDTVGAFAAAFIGWTVYGALTYFAFGSISRRTFYLLFVILCVLLLMNVRGCSMQVDDSLAHATI